jgi:hypothetical protein
LSELRKANEEQQAEKEADENVKATEQVEGDIGQHLLSL